MEKRIGTKGNLKEMLLKAGMLAFLVFAAVMICRATAIHAKSKAKGETKASIEAKIAEYEEQVKDLEAKIAKEKGKSKRAELESNLEKVQAAIDECKNALTAEITAEVSTFFLDPGEKFEIPYEFSDKTYNKLTWKSNDEKVVKVSDKGVLTAGDYGEAKVTVKSSISESKVTFYVHVCKLVNSVTAEDEIFVNYNQYKKKKLVIPIECDPADGDVLLYNVNEIEGEKSVLALVEKECTEKEIVAKVKGCGTELVGVFDHKGNLLKKITVYIYKPLTSLKFRYPDYAVPRDDYTCTFKLITKPKKANEKIYLTYDEDLVEITELGYGEYQAKLLKDQRVTIIVTTKSGLETSTELVPVDPGSDDDDPDDNIEDDYTEDNLED